MRLEFVTLWEIYKSESLEKSVQPLFPGGRLAFSFPAPFLRLGNSLPTLRGEMAILLSGVFSRAVGMKSVGWGIALQQSARLF